MPQAEITTPCRTRDAHGAERQPLRPAQVGRSGRHEGAPDR
ncbi:hypothetical protein BMAPRL20_A2641 [Burkholderia mallei PRL-20]|uniref:Uncharacterized protein n=1 Tax=Burkholderia mallei (strain NCTC 10229) TaxID=412022 RepID=A2S5H2_BURM9|nr:hypothetical protein BMA10229_A1206 [Burkholderia mallei NCTC 10229]EDS88280.1 hypothetical protein BURPSS13_U0009 [Burkholderia pseudomallei S13]EEP88312.1 conserved hypothetical protein [Burkholderia mallei GB8 horse 4]EES47379.1 hypothetical protein BMAPRL20_A2641 [Burkholderia mallei PRL-20]